MNMKRTLALVLTIAICATMALGGTLAYLTDTEKAVNVMTVGSVEIEQYEQERGEEGLENFTQNQTIVPAVPPEGDVTKEVVTVNGYDVQIRDNVKNYVDKIVSVKNTGIADAYVRTILAIPSTPNEANNLAYDNWLHWNGVSDTDTDPTNGWHWGTEENGLEWPGNNEGWNRIDDVIIDGKEYDLFVATNVNVLEPGDATAPSLLGFYLDQRVDAERLPDGTLNHYIVLDGVKNDLGDLTNMKIYVATQAVQADGFENAWQALRRAFDDISAENHPWLNEPETLDVDVSWYNDSDTEFNLASAEQLAGLAALVNGGNSFHGKTVNLTADVDLNMVQWTPIGRSNDNAFAGTFDGNGHTISNLYVNEDTHAGFFGFLYHKSSTGVVKNLHVENANIQSTHYAGTIAAYAYASIENCSANKVIINCVDVNGEDGGHAGGIVGFMGEGNYRLTDCQIGNATITANRNAGHIVGTMQAGVNISGEGSFGTIETKWSGYGSGENVTNDTWGKSYN